jgi:hypothetical protein
MTSIRVTVRVEIELSDGSTSIVERTVTPRGFGDNPIFFGDVAEKSAHVAAEDVRNAIESVHGVAPSPARVVLN